MKELISIMILSTVGFFTDVIPAVSVNMQTGISGAWVLKDGNTTHTIVVVDDYFSISSFDQTGKKFINTYGGTCRLSSNNLEGKIEFNAAEKDMVGKTISYAVEQKNNQLTLKRNNKIELWEQTDDGKGALAGYWRIVRRDQNAMNPGARKTIKLLSGKRFQWAAINTETGEFFGTGGGNYTFENGRYTENIEFFSRDSSRVGMSLSFDGRVEGKEWFHSGLSSRGDKINEVWARR